MANASFPPPQAYTKEVLTEAYAWFMKQSDAIKERATTPDAMVSLYLRHKRNNGGKVSAEEFKSELKNLAGMMDHFTPSQPEAPSFQNTSVAPPTPQPQPVVEKPVSKTVENPNLLESLDRQTQMVLYEVKMHLNLSSELEAMRMLIRLGYHRVKDLLNEDDSTPSN